MASPSTSPQRKKHCVQPITDDPDEELDKLLNAGQSSTVATTEDAPAWAIAMQSTLQLQIQRSHNLMISFHDRLQKLEAGEENQEMAERISKLENTVKELLEKGGEGKASFNRVPPPGQHDQKSSPLFTPVAQHGPNRGALSETHADYCHLIIGGWDDGSKRDEILKSARRVLDLHQPPLEIQDLVVYGKRSTISHLYLPPMEHQMAYERYATIREQLHDRHPTSDRDGATKMWFAASKPKEVRMRNRKIMKARVILEDLVRESGVQCEIDIEWSKGLIWGGSYRIASDTRETLMPNPEDCLISFSTDDTQPHAMFFFSLTKIASLLGKSQVDVEKGLFSRQ